MNLYLSSFTTQHLVEYTRLFPDEKLNILVSYGLRNQNIADFISEHEDKINSLILDSGTFTMNFAQQEVTRKKIDFEGYRAFLKTIGHRFDYAFNFDSNFADHGQDDNDRYMRILQDDGLNVVPVVHSYSEREVKHYLKEGHTIIALGYSEGKKTEANIKKLSQMIHDNGAKVHVLGISTWKKLAHTPVAYCDSSSWMQYGRFGIIQYWNEDKIVPADSDKTDSIHFKDSLDSKSAKHQFHDYAHGKQLYKWIKDEFGWDYYELMASDSMMKRTLVNIHYFVQLQKRITAHHEKLGFKM